MDADTQMFLILFSVFMIVSLGIANFYYNTYLPNEERNNPEIWVYLDSNLTKRVLDNIPFKINRPVAETKYVRVFYVHNPEEFLQLIFFNLEFSPPEMEEYIKFSTTPKSEWKIKPRETIEVVASIYIFDNKYLTDSWIQVRVTSEVIE